MRILPIPRPPCQDELDTVLPNIREKLIAGVEKRLDADTPVGFLLSGGLDSSLVCSIAAKKLGKPIRTFAIGMDTDAIDLKYARQTAEYLHSDHHRDHHQPGDGHQRPGRGHPPAGHLGHHHHPRQVGMYLLCKSIHEQTDIRVLLTGEISDELFGYKYTDFAPTADAFQQKARSASVSCTCTMCCAPTAPSASTAWKPACPFGDLDFVRYVMAIDPAKKLNSYGKGKYLLRKAFEGDWLPEDPVAREGRLLRRGGPLHGG